MPRRRAHGADRRPTAARRRRSRCRCRLAPAARPSVAFPRRGPPDQRCRGRWTGRWTSAQGPCRRSSAANRQHQTRIVRTPTADPFTSDCSSAFDGVTWKVERSAGQWHRRNDSPADERLVSIGIGSPGQGIGSPRQSGICRVSGVLIARGKRAVIPSRPLATCHVMKSPPMLRRQPVLLALICAAGSAIPRPSNWPTAAASPSAVKRRPRGRNARLLWSKWKLDQRTSQAITNHGTCRHDVLVIGTGWSR